MVWVVTYQDISNGDKTTTVWDDKAAAQKDVCANIVDDINDSWDFSDTDCVTTAQTIEAFIKNSQWQDAIEAWNDWSSTYDAGIYWSVSFEDLFLAGDAANPSAIIWPAPAVVVDEEVPPTLPTGFAPTTQGATCRGPCHQWNEYASADKMDGTFICYQCKTMGAIFGSKA